MSNTSCNQATRISAEDRITIHELVGSYGFHHDQRDFVTSCRPRRDHRSNQAVQGIPI
jgi:hypothetical protein